MMTFASARERNHSRLRHSSRNLALKLSVTPFCQGLPGSINAVLIPCATIQDKIAFDTNSALAHERRRFGYRRLHVFLRREGFIVNHKRLFPLYREERLMVRR